MNLEREPFEAWLFSQPLDRVIESTDTTNCFFCSFLKETSRIKQPYFTFSTYGIEGERIWHLQPIPAWAQRLISPATTRRLTNDDHSPHSPITVKAMQEHYIELFGNPNPPVSDQPQPETVHPSTLHPETTYA